MLAGQVCMQYNCLNLVWYVNASVVSVLTHSLLFIYKYNCLLSGLLIKILLLLLYANIECMVFGTAIFL